MSGSGGVEQGEADYLGAIGRRIYVQPPVSSTFGSFLVFFTAYCEAHLHRTVLYTFVLCNSTTLLSLRTTCTMYI